MNSENNSKSPEQLKQEQLNKQQRSIRFAGLNWSFFILIVFGFVAIHYFTGCWQKTAVASLWALAALALGAIVGLLFGIQRVVQNKEEGATKNEINNNLAEVSDWLTKIIVGVGLVELSTLPGKIHKVAQPLADCLAGCVGSQCGLAMALAIIIFYSAVGFLIGFVDYRTLIALMISEADYDVQNPNKTLQQMANQVDEVAAKMQMLSVNQEISKRENKWFELTQSALTAADRAVTNEDKASANGQLKNILSQLQQAQASQPTSRILAILIGRLHEQAGQVQNCLSVLKTTLDKRREAKINPNVDDAALFYNLACYENKIAIAASSEAEKERLRESAWAKLKESCKIDGTNKQEAAIDSYLEGLFDAPNRKQELL